MLNVSNRSLPAPHVDQTPPNASDCGWVMKYGCLDRCASRRHSYHPSAGTRQRRSEKGRAKAFDVAMVSARALIIRAAPDGSRDHAGTSPQWATLSTGSSLRDE